MQRWSVPFAVALVHVALSFSACRCGGDEAPRATPSTGIVMDAHAGDAGTAVSGPDPAPLDATPAIPAEHLDRAVAAGDDALSKQWHAKRRRGARGPTEPPRVDRGEATLTPVSGGGWIVTWSRHPPGGFEYDVVITLDDGGKAVVTRAEVVFADD